MYFGKVKYRNWCNYIEIFDSWLHMCSVMKKCLPPYMRTVKLNISLNILIFCYSLKYGPINGYEYWFYPGCGESSRETLKYSKERFTFQSTKKQPENGRNNLTRKPCHISSPRRNQDMRSPMKYGNEKQIIVEVILGK